jgi:hypothetical protein
MNENVISLHNSPNLYKLSKNIKSIKIELDSNNDKIFTVFYMNDNSSSIKCRTLVDVFEKGQYKIYLEDIDCIW